jgi:3-oxoacyl-[acyl-carrier protein] reductase
MAALAGRVAVVTGASSGIGAGLAAMLADEGARVVLAARRGKELERVATEIRETAITIDAGASRKIRPRPGRARAATGRPGGELSSPAGQAQPG